ncbi:unnamed protein product [Ilex paraguariensis]|uniref:AAA+ ATPase domain-containing protein n=1 Tax=Ilex paraguariensis TaxID=185542 RepID=A0ABC8URR1_9AQUA
MSNMFDFASMPSPAALFSAYTTFTALAFTVRTVIYELQRLANQLIPQQIQEKILSKLGSLAKDLSSFFEMMMTLVIHEYDGLSINEIFGASEIFLRTKITPSIDRLKVFKAPKDKNISVTIEKGEKIIDVFQGIHLTWQMICNEKRDSDGDTDELKSFELRFERKYKEKVLSSYLPYVLERSKAIQEENKLVKLYSFGNSSMGDGSVNLDHPSTFDTLAMDPKLKKELIEDLDRFVRRRDYYRRVGKAWKRGYLLYGPPGTGKSSLIAAMANYLKFHIYDLEMSKLMQYSSPKNLLLSTANRSILVIEDIDCGLDLGNRQVEGDDNKHMRGQLSLSELLNFIDGLWSSCGDERIIVFTTNHKERLDPALLRPGRMDMHIHMSYCTPCGFKILASNYLGLGEGHCMFSEIETLITEVEVTPAEVAEELMKSEDTNIALAGLLTFLQKKKELTLTSSAEPNIEGLGEEVDHGEGNKIDEGSQE